MNPLWDRVLAKSRVGLLMSLFKHAQSFESTCSYSKSSGEHLATVGQPRSRNNGDGPTTKQQSTPRMQVNAPHWCSVCTFSSRVFRPWNQSPSFLVACMVVKVPTVVQDKRDGAHRRHEYHCYAQSRTSHVIGMFSRLCLSIAPFLTNGRRNSRCSGVLVYS
jgi:hypothetical protein